VKKVLPVFFLKVKIQRKKNKNQNLWVNEHLAHLLAVKSQTKATRDNKSDG
jgi:hypothetical protein